VILVSVGQKETPNVAGVLPEPSKIRMKHVQPEVLVRKGDAAIHDEDIALLLDGEAVHADFAEAAERYEANAVCGRGRHVVDDCNANSANVAARTRAPAKTKRRFSEVDVAEIKQVSPEEAQDLLQQGYVYVDVRSEPEYEQGHVPGALNVPLNQRSMGRMTPNPDFLTVMKNAFAPDERIVVGCGSGPRSAKAAQMLAEAGFTEIVELGVGFDGKRDAFGRIDPGWSRKGLPVEKGNTPGGVYEDVKQRTRG